MKHFIAYAHSATTANQEALKEERIDWSFHVTALDYADAWAVASTHVAWKGGDEDAVLIGMTEHPGGVK